MHTILLVDQKPSTAILIKTYLAADGYDVDHTPDPKEAVEFASQLHYRLVITDLVMQGMSGIDLCREIKSCNMQVSFVFLLTPSADALKLMGSLERDDVIKKEPLSMNEVMHKVRAAFAS
ncbi:MAG: response regulator [Nitrososphaera sp.]|jgi:DNA-binding response OmpR family regulator